MYCWKRIVARKNGKDIISRKHAEIEMSVDKANQKVRYVIKDVGALNGVYVNNCRIKDHVLSNGDIIQFGGLFNMPMGEILTISDISVRYQYFSSTSSEMTSTSNDTLKKRPLQSSEEASHLIDTDISVRKKLKFSNQDMSTQDSTPSNGVPKKKSSGNSSSNKNANSNGSGSGSISGATTTIAATNRKGSTPELLERSHLEEAMRDLKVKVSQLEKENAEYKKSAQASASSAREEALAKSKLSREILALQQSLSQRDHSVANLTEQLRLLERKAQEEDDLTPSLPVAALRADLTCVLCNKMLLETVVLHCSHGFCRVCLEFRLQGKTGGRKEGHLTCPTCNLTCRPRSRPLPSPAHPTKAQGTVSIPLR